MELHPNPLKNLQSIAANASSDFDLQHFCQRVRLQYRFPSHVVSALDLGNRNPSVGALQALTEAVLGLLEVDDVPNGIEVLDRGR